MKKKEEVKESTITFSPALTSLLRILTAEFNKNVSNALTSEAQHLGLPPGTSFDLQQLVWILKKGN